MSTNALCAVSFYVGLILGLPFWAVVFGGVI